MYYKKSLYLKICSIFLLMISTLSIVTASCILGFQGSCPVYTTTNLQVDVQGETVDDVSLTMYEKVTANPLIIKNQTIQDVFKNPGVYEVSALPKAKSGQLHSLKTKEFIVDMAQPQPPVVDSLIYGDFDVSTQYHGDIIVVKDKQGNELQRVTLSDSTSTTLSLPQSGFVSISVIRNSLESEPVKRYYYREKPIFEDTLATSIQLNVADIEAINKVEGGKTHTQLFFITGTAQGDILYVNGQKIVVQDGSFGAFVELNEGENTLEIIGESTKTYRVVYEEQITQFEELDMDKLISSNSATISGTLTTNEPLLIYIDGSFYEQISPNNRGEFEFTLNSITQQKTYVQIKSYDGLSYETYIYKDQENPTISFNSFTTLSSEEFVSFVFQDDMGVEEESIELTQGNQTFHYSDFMRHGDYYLFPVKKLQSGQFDVSLQDRVGNSATTTQSITIDDSTPYPLNMSVTGSKFKAFGNHLLFSKLGEQQLRFVMNEPFAFEHIYINDVDQTNYEIFSDNSMELDFELRDTSGTISFTYINDENEKFEREYSYEVVSPQTLQIESLSNLHLKQSGNTISLTGFFENSKFIDKNSLKINGVKPLWFGKNLEVHSIKEDDITIRGYDVLSRSISPSSEISNQISYSTSFTGNQPTPSKTLKLDVRTPNPNQLYYISSIDSQKQKYVYFKDSTKYSSSQIQGKRVVSSTINQNGNSQEVFFEQIIDSVEPKIYLAEQQNSNYLIVDGTFSEVEENYEINVSTSSCSLTNSPNHKCLEIEKDVSQIDITIRDRAGNTLSKQMTISELPLFNLSSFSSVKIYFTGNQRITPKDKTYLKGHYIAPTYPQSVSTPQGTCVYDQQNFGCPIQIQPGETTYEVTFVFENQEITKQWNITKPQKEVSLNLESIAGNENIYNLGGLTYYFGGNVSITGSSTLPQPTSYDSQNHPDSVVLEINGRKVFKKVSGTGIITFNLGDELSVETQDVDEKVISIQAISQDQQSGESKSNTLTLMYAKLNELLVSIIFE